MLHKKWAKLISVEYDRCESLMCKQDGVYWDKNMYFLKPQMRPHWDKTGLQFHGRPTIPGAKIWYNYGEWGC